MKAELLNLEGKYYGTQIKITDINNSYVITIWDDGDFIPSPRELEGICTIDEWKNNKIIEKHLQKAQDIIEFNNHVESNSTYNFVVRLINKINSK